jgi:hypothetical protein
VSARDARLARYIEQLRARERRFARQMAAKHGRAFVLESLRTALAGAQVDRWQARLAGDVFEELGARAPTMRIRNRRFVKLGGPPFLAVPLIRTLSLKPTHTVAAA